MKKRRTLIISLLLVAAIVLGVGYAALTDILDIQGTAEISIGKAEEAFNEDVYFSDVSQGNGYTASINADNNDKASFTATGFTKEGDTISITYTIKNDNEDYDALVTPKLLQNSNAEYFYISSDWQSTPQTIEKMGEKTITVTVEPLKLPTGAELAGASFNIELTAVTVEDEAPATTDTEAVAEG